MSDYGAVLIGLLYLVAVPTISVIIGLLVGSEILHWRRAKRRSRPYHRADWKILQSMYPCTPEEELKQRRHIMTQRYDPETGECSCHCLLCVAMFGVEPEDKT